MSLPPAWIRLLLVVVAIGLPIAAVVSVRATDDRPALDDETRAMLRVIDATVAALEPAWPVTPIHLDNTPPPFAPLEPRLDYDACDDWQSWLRPGYTAFLGYAIDARDAVDRANVTRTVEALWASSSGDLRIERGLVLEFEHTHVSLTLNEVEGTLDLHGGTTCLPRK